MRVLARLSGPGLALGLLALLVAAPAWAADPTAEYEAIRRASLKGIDSLEVIVPPPRGGSGCGPVSTDHIQTKVEARLERVGIRVGPAAAS